MDRYDSRHYLVSRARSFPMLDVVVAGPYIATQIVAEERLVRARQWAAIRSAAPQVGAREPGPWRRRLGARLVQVGARLQGAAAAPRVPQPAAVASSAGAAG
jgi:hypothetical protein